MCVCVCTFFFFALSPSKGWAFFVHMCSMFCALPGHASLLGKRVVVALVQLHCSCFLRSMMCRGGSLLINTFIIFFLAWELLLRTTPESVALLPSPFAQPFPSLHHPYTYIYIYLSSINTYKYIYISLQRMFFLLLLCYQWCTYM